MGTTRAWTETKPLQDAETSSLEASDLLPRIYDELRSMALIYLEGERLDHTLQPTALVHEAYLKIAGPGQANWNDIDHFRSVAAKVMRNILVKYARDRNRLKRGGKRQKYQLEETLSSFEVQVKDLVVLDEALTRLETISPRQARIVELRFFGGLTVKQVAQSLDVSTFTVENDWRIARVWLLREIMPS